MALAVSACADDSNEAGDAAAAAGSTVPESSVDPAPTPAPTPSVPDAFTPVIAATVGDETAPVLGSDGQWHVVYELLLTNANAVPATIDRIDVLDDDDQERVLYSLTGDDLAERERMLSGRPRVEPDESGLITTPDLEPNESMVVLVELEFASDEDVPDTIVHRLVGTGGAHPGASEPAPVEYLLAPWRITDRTAATVGAPLAGDNWMVINGCCTDAGAHRGSIQTISGELHDAQRFAIDWMRIGPNGRLFEGDPSDVTSWFGYGEPVFAIADGTVVEVLDELDDQAPGSLPDPGSITIETVDGNHVIIDFGGGVYAFYAHLKLGSVTVEEGDTVRAGDQIGELGNSGNTSAPHLHLHLMNRPSALAADSIPYGFVDMTVTGVVDHDQWMNSSDALDDEWIVHEAVDVPDVPVLPMDLDVVTFGDG